MTTQGKTKGKQPRPTGKTGTRRLQILHQILTEVQEDPQPIGLADLKESALYASSSNALRALQGDIKHWTKRKERALVYSPSEDGPIAALPIVPHDTRFLRDLYHHQLEKQAVATHAVDRLLSSYHLVFLDSGTTMFYIAFNLAQSEIGHNLRIITNNLYIIPILSGKIPINIVGGTVEKDKAYIVKSPTYDLYYEEVNKGRIQQSFISITGMSYDQGFYCEDALVDDKQQAIKSAQKSVTFVMDHSKAGTTKGRGSRLITTDELTKLKSDEGNSIDISIVTDDYIKQCPVETCKNIVNVDFVAKELEKFRNTNIEIKTVLTNILPLR